MTKKKLFDNVTRENFLLFAAHYYDNPQCTSPEEFYEDLKRFKYLKKLLKQYIKTGEFKERLILNHIIVILNVFGVKPGAQLLFFQLEPELQPILKTCLIKLKALPEYPPINKDIQKIPLDNNVISILRKI